ncbi:MAG TPA: hypothetical protein VNO30_18520 [Kofleriaceae bacterium]|nr:hypothetical protein [Kofleriaceae bacterium]
MQSPMQSPMHCLPLVALASALAPALAAADIALLSALPEKPVRYAQAPGPIAAVVAPFSPTRDSSGHEVRATGAGCLVYDPPKYWIDGEGDLMRRYPEMEIGDPTPFGIERLVTRGDTAELERVIANVVFGELVPISRSRITLREVATLPGLAVYAYRWGANVYLITRSSSDPVRRRDGGTGLEDSIGCGTVMTTLRLRGGSSELAQIRGTVPATGKRYVIDASVVQTGRDPEPLLSVVARLVDR